METLHLLREMETLHLLRERQDTRRRELIAVMESAQATLAHSQALYARAAEMLAATNELLVKRRDVQTGGRSGPGCAERG